MDIFATDLDLANDVSAEVEYENTILADWEATDAYFADWEASVYEDDPTGGAASPY